MSRKEMFDSCFASEGSTMHSILFIFDIEGVDAYKVKDITDARILK
jgi:hypothetical protein